MSTISMMNVNEMIVYHGGYQEIEYPEIRVGRYTKDFSWGFYCTEIQEQAQKWRGYYYE